MPADRSSKKSRSEISASTTRSGKNLATTGATTRTMGTRSKPNPTEPSTLDARLTVIEPLLEANTFKLLVPSNTDCGKAWAPRQHSPSIILTRVGTIRDSRHPEISRSVPRIIQHGGSQPVEAKEDEVKGKVEMEVKEEVEAESMPTLVLGQSMGRQSCLDVFGASLCQDDKNLAPTGGFALKFLDLNFFPVEHPYEITVSLAQKIFCEEAQNFAEAGEAACLPRFAGAFACGQLYCLVFEDAGRAITDEERNSRAALDEILEAFEHLMALGVFLFMPSWNVIRRGAGGRIKFATLLDAYMKSEAERSLTESPQSDKPIALRLEEDLAQSREEAYSSLRDEVMHYDADWIGP